VSRATAFYRRGIRNAFRTFEHDEATISHAFRSPHVFLGGRTYGEALYRAVRREGGRVDRVLEIGGGLGDLAAGFLTAWTRERRVAGPEYTLLDISPRLAAAQRQRLRGFGRRVRFVRRDACALGWPPGSLDGLVICNEVIAALDGDDVSLRDRGTAARLERWALRGVLPGSRFIFPRGVARLLDGLTVAAAPGTRVVLIDYFDLSHRGGQWVRIRGHRECAFDLDLVCHLARQSGWSVRVDPLANYLGLCVSEPVATARLVERLLGLGHRLSPSRFWTRRDLASETGQRFSGQDDLFDSAGLVHMLSSFHAIRLERPYSSEHCEAHPAPPGRGAWGVGGHREAHPAPPGAERGGCGGPSRGPPRS
jgi:SAM-dependent methyltransferase